MARKSLLTKDLDAQMAELKREMKRKRKEQAVAFVEEAGLMEFSLEVQRGAIAELKKLLQTHNNIDRFERVGKELLRDAKPQTRRRKAQDEGDSQAIEASGQHDQAA